MLNTCIGARNYTFFLLLVGDLCVLAVLMSMSFFAYSAGSAVQPTGGAQGSSAVVSLGTMVLGLAILLIFVLLMVLCGYHVYLVTQGSTTRENLKGRETKSRRTTFLDLIRRDPSRFNLRDTVVAVGGSRRPPNAEEEYEPA
jgi:membrane protein implicated in regulation of membrane protease activity